MNLKLKRYGILMGIITLILVSVLAIQVDAADPTTGSITIIAHEQQNGDTATNPPMEGIEYTVYKVDETCESNNSAESYIEDNQVEGISKITGEDGTVIFDNLELGRYFVDVTSVSDGAIYDEHYSDFLIDIPMTNAEGTGWDYDIIVEPKFQTAFGNLELTKIDSEGNPIEGVTFKVQVMKRILEYSLEDIEPNIWADYIPEGSDEVLTLTTDENGKIYLNNLPSYYKVASLPHTDYVIYRLIEVSAPDGYIINNAILSQLYFTVNGDGSIYVEHSDDYFIDYVEEENLTKVTYINEKPEIEKKVQNSNGEFVDSIGTNVTDRLTFKITADVPIQMAFIAMPTYKITDELPNGIMLNRESIKIEGKLLENDSIVTLPEDLYTLSQEELELNFNTDNLYKYSNYYGLVKIIITYEATIDKDNIVIGGDGNINTATLEYTNKINENGDEESTTTVSDTAEVHTGAVLLEKVEKGNVSTKLAGAKFKIATTKDNAENGVFVQDETGADIEVTTGENGQAIIEGLKYADDGSDTLYWLVETQAPSYVEDGVTKYYNLLKAPVEVKVGKTTHQSAVQISNGKGFDLPETGSIGLVIFLVVGISIMSVAYVLNKKQIKE